MFFTLHSEVCDCSDWLHIYLSSSRDRKHHFHSCQKNVNLISCLLSVCVCVCVNKNQLCCLINRHQTTKKLQLLPLQGNSWTPRVHAPEVMWLCPQVSSTMGTSSTFHIHPIDTTSDLGLENFREVPELFVCCVPLISMVKSLHWIYGQKTAELLWVHAGASLCVTWIKHLFSNSFRFLLQSGSINSTQCCFSPSG